MRGGFGDYAKYGSIGISWVLSTAVYLYLGYRLGTWLDARFNVEPLCMVGGILFGAVLSLVSLTRELMALDKAFRERVGKRQGFLSAGDRERKHFPEVRGMPEWRAVPSHQNERRPGLTPRQGDDPPENGRREKPPAGKRK